MDPSDEAVNTLTNESGVEVTESPENPTRMKPYLIAVICMSVIVGFVVLYKVYKQIKSGRAYIPCCDQQSNRAQSTINRRDTSRPLIRDGSNASDNGGSIYRHGSQRPVPSMV